MDGWRSTDSPPAACSSPDAALQQLFGLTSFLPGQREAIDALLAGQDTVVVLPTGGGKSLIFQLAALLLPGTTLVISPLIALIRDQTLSLESSGYPAVAALHSQVRDREARATLAALREGRIRLLYLTPERCAAAEFLNAARRTRISLIAVDEAHAISEWGHDFRPEYQLLGEAAERLGRPPMLALTATATPPVREDIKQMLGLRRPRLVVSGFDRPNLFYEVYKARGPAEKRQILTGLIPQAEAPYPAPLGRQLAEASAGSGIVYTTLTRTARALSQALNQAGVLAAYYHGQLKAGQRNAVQEHFRDDRLRAVVATYAFGLGIDLPDLRWVVHYDASPSLEAYYQETGRAGRDGDLARCPLIYFAGDLGRAAFEGGTGATDAESLERVAAVLQKAPAGGVPRTAIVHEAGLPEAQAMRALKLLTGAGAASGRRGRYQAAAMEPERIEQALVQEERRQRHQPTRIDMVRAYAEVESCRRQFLLQYFGQYDAPDHCGMCDRCVPRTSEARLTSAPPEPREAAGSPFHPGDAVIHQQWGPGVVQHVSATTLTIHFADAGYRTLDFELVIEKRLLRREDAV